MLERYTLPPMKELWSEGKKINMWLEVELAFLEARFQCGDLSGAAYEAIATHAHADCVRIAELETPYQHDFEAFVGAVKESTEKAGFDQYKAEFHKTLTTSDTEDTATILLLRYALELIKDELIDLAVVLRKQAKRYQWTIMSARTHGQDAKPSTFGHLLAVFTEDVNRDIHRLSGCLENELLKAKMSGAVGNYIGIDPMWEKEALRSFGLLPANTETQILQRDRHAVVMAELAVIASTLEKHAVALRQMAHACVQEVREPFAEDQRGSSAMPHKRNPVKLEQMSGLARMVRAYAQVAMENIATWEWRDISHSSAERHIFSGATSIVHYMVVKMKYLIEHLEVFPKRMWENLIASQEIWASQGVREALTDAGIDSDVAYHYVQEAAFRVPTEKASFQELLQNMPISETDSRTALAILGSERFNQCFDMCAAITPGIEHIFS